MQKNEKIIQEITLELLELVDDNFRKTYQKQFKNGIEILGIHTPKVRKISQKYFNDKLSELSPKEIIEISEFLIHRNAYEFKIVAFTWCQLVFEKFKEEDFSVFEYWLYKYIHHWSSCDKLSKTVISNFLLKFPKLRTEMISWSKLPINWIRRAANISFIPLVKKKIFLDEFFIVAENSLLDDDYLVNKGAVSLIKAASKSFPDLTLSFIEKMKDKLQPKIFSELSKHYLDKKK